jgi:hypothetical protein
MGMRVAEVANKLLQQMLRGGADECYCFSLAIPFSVLFVSRFCPCCWACPWKVLSRAAHHTFWTFKAQRLSKGYNSPSKRGLEILQDKAAQASCTNLVIKFALHVVGLTDLF